MSIQQHLLVWQPEDSGGDGKKGPEIGQAVLGRIDYGLLDFSYSSYVSLW